MKNIKQYKQSIRQSIVASGILCFTTFYAEESVSNPDNLNNTILPEMVVEGEREYDPYDPTNTSDPYNKSYSVTNSTTATKTYTPILETPVSISIVPRQLLDDKQAIRISDGLKHYSGINSGFSFRASGGNEAFVLRGFNTEFQTNGALSYREGVRLQGFPQPVASLDRVEFLKGPAAILYGRAEPGGIINLVPKDSLTTTYYSLQQQFGSYDLYRTSVDATGPITADDTLLYRLNLEYLNTGSFRDFIFNDLLDIAPTLTWNISPDTQVELEFEYSRNVYNSDYGVPAFGKRPANIPITRTFSEQLARSEQDTYLVDLDLTHHFNADWEFRAKGMYAHQDIFILDIFGFAVNEDLSSGQPVGEFGRYAYFEPDSNRDSWFASGNLLGKFSLLGIKHSMLFGAEYYRDDYDMASIFGPQLASINIFNPVYGRVREQDLRDPSSLYDWRSFQEWYSFYIQDQIDLTEQLHLLLGGRYDDTESFSNYQNPFEPVAESALTQRYGLVYQPWSWLSIYGHYVESFGTNNGRADPAQRIGAFKAQTAEQYEVGVKSEFFDGRLSSTLAFFHLTKQNILTPDPDNPLFQVAIGEARSRGIELDVSGEVIDGLQLLGSYAYLDTETTDDNTVDDNGNYTRRGKQLPNAPQHAANLWATYEVQAGFWRGLTFGAGTYIVGKRQGDFENSYQMPGYVRVDAMAGYGWQFGKSRLKLQVNINNLLDKEYYKASYDNRAWILPGEPLTVMGSIRLEY